MPMAPPPSPATFPMKVHAVHVTSPAPELAQMPPAMMPWPSVRSCAQALEATTGAHLDGAAEVAATSLEAGVAVVTSPVAMMQPSWPAP